MKPLQFTAEMFVSHSDPNYQRSISARHAQAAFDDWLKGLPTVYKWEVPQFSWTEYLIDNRKMICSAKLLMIDPINPKCTNHEPWFLGLEKRYEFNNQINGVVMSHDCKHCGVKIKPTVWTEV